MKIHEENDVRTILVDLTALVVASRVGLALSTFIALEPLILCLPSLKMGAEKTEKNWKHSPASVRSPAKLKC